VAVDKKLVVEAVNLLLAAIGEDYAREGLEDTPARVARFWAEFIDYDPGNVDTTFESITTDQLVAVSGIRVWSLCEHHLLPFSSDITIAYVSADKVLGLSKLARVAHLHAHKLQLQERLVDDVFKEVQQLAETVDVAVIADGRHLCMELRGIKTPATMHTSRLGGCFRAEPEARAELFAMVGRHAAV